eukprot:Phypoly_transcript_18204.p1 GENE.Phypoly_transcript_18204~~Phypoly_transcript_18204.p1  ORF type:complete len:237 (+),score=9.28 Phypoly_transcript_18204:42-713(+)
MDSPLLPQQKSFFNRKVILGISFFCFFLIAILAVVVLSYSTVPKEHDQRESALDYSNGSLALTIPCTQKGAGYPAGCDNTRVRTVPCGSQNSNGHPTSFVDDNTACTNAKVSLNQPINMQFYQIPGTSNCLEITAQIGECWGTSPLNGDDYSCQGQCGAGCVKGCSIFAGGGPWARSCFRHDICSWYFGATGGAKDTYCGPAYNQAINDFFKCECNTVSLSSC